MAENSETSITVIQNGRTEDQKNIVKNGDNAHVPDAETHQLENGDIKKIPEEEPTTSTEEVTTNSATENTTDVAEKQELETKIQDGSVTVKNDTEVIEGVIEEIKEGIEIIHTFINKENEPKINHEVEGGFQLVNVNDKSVKTNEPKNDEIITLQEVTIIPLEEEQNRVSKNSKSAPKLVSWDTKKTVFFYFFLIAFVVWIVAYYAFDTGLIPNDKSSKK